MKLISNGDPMNKMTKLIAMTALALSVTTPVGASITPAVLNEKNKQQVSQASADILNFHKDQQDACADPTQEGSLAEKQAKAMEEQKKLATKPIDLGNIYDVGKKGGCFVALSDFPDLSVSIPSLTGIMNSIKDTLVKYAVRKACAVVDEAFSEMLGPIQDALNQVSDRGQLDLTGAVNKEMAKKLYEIDPELGRVGTSAESDRDYDFKW